MFYLIQPLPTNIYKFKTFFSLFQSNFLFHYFISSFFTIHLVVTHQKNIFPQHTPAKLKPFDVCLPSDKNLIFMSIFAHPESVVLCLRQGYLFFIHTKCEWGMEAIFFRWKNVKHLWKNVAVEKSNKNEEITDFMLLFPLILHLRHICGCCFLTSDSCAKIVYERILCWLTTENSRSNHLHTLQERDDITRAISVYF